MKAQTAEPTLARIEPDEVRQALDRLLWSKYFVNAHKKQKFVRLICDYYLEGRAHELNEHILGYDVFGRDNSYNPSSDPIVRAFAHGVRKKLEAYYATEGANDAVRLEIPAGSYQPVFIRHLPEPVSEPAETTLPPQAEPASAPIRRRLPIGKLVVGLAVLGLAVTVMALALTNRQLRQEMARADAAKDP